MTDREYVRVNVTSLTSTPRYNEAGERYAEMDMQLPSNLIGSDNISSARMMITKAKLSMAGIPAFSCPVTRVSEDNKLETPYKIITIPVRTIDAFYPNGKIKFLNEPSDKEYFANRTDLKKEIIKVFPSRVHEFDDSQQASLLANELLRGYHNFNSISDFLTTISAHLQSCLFNNQKNWGPSQSKYSPGFIDFILNSNNTISLQCVPYSIPYTGVDLGTPTPYNSHLAFTTSNGHNAGTYSELPILTTLNGSDLKKVKPVGYFFACNEALQQKLFTLPWLKYHPSHPVGDWDLKEDGDLYILDTTVATMSLSQNPGLDYTNLGDGAIIGSKILTYSFPESDAISLADLNAIVLTLDGANFTNQILPVNMNEQNLADAQTTTIPVITFYFPVWSQPTDTNTDLIIKEDNFTNGGPLTIDPQLLKQRLLRFKFSFITNTGQMRDMFIPKNNLITLQVCFELTRSEETTSMMI